MEYAWFMYHTIFIVSLIKISPSLETSFFRKLFMPPIYLMFEVEDIAIEDWIFCFVKKSVFCFTFWGLLNDVLL